MKTQKTYIFKGLSLAHLSDVAVLQKTIIDTLPAEKKSFVRQKSKSVFTKFLTPPHGAVGAFTADGVLVGAAFLTEHEGHAGDDCWAPCPFTRKFLGKNRGEKIGVIGGVMVAPTHEGQGVMKNMLMMLMARAREYDFHHLVAAVGARNAPSIKGFQALGYEMRGIDHADSDGRALVFMCQKVRLPVRRGLRCGAKLAGSFPFLTKKQPAPLFS